MLLEACVQVQSREGERDRGSLGVGLLCRPPNDYKGVSPFEPKHGCSTPFILNSALSRSFCERIILIRVI